MSTLTRGTRDAGNFGRAPVNVSPLNAASTNGAGQPVSVLQFAGKKDEPETVYASLFAFGQGATTPLGPLVAIAEWGSGHSMHAAIFDLPINGTIPGTPINGSDLQGGGTTIAIPCTALNIKVRNDAALIPPIGNAALGGTLNPALLGVPTVSASMAVGNRPSSPLVRTVWAVNATPGNGLGAGNTATILVPPFAKRVSFPRDTSQPIAVTFLGPSAGDGPYTVAAGAVSPEFLIGQFARVRVQNTGAAEILQLAGLFQLSL